MEYVKTLKRSPDMVNLAKGERSSIRPVSTRMFAVVCLLLGLQIIATRAVNIDERSLPIPGLHQVSMEFGAWKAAREQNLDASVTEYLRPDEYILRDYFNPGRASVVNLFVAYFKSLQNSYGPHSPRVCLPGNGWLERSSRVRKIQVPGRAEGIDVNEFVLEKGTDRILVLYWYQNNRKVWAEEFQAKLRLLPDLLRYRRSDVSLVRLVTAVRGEDTGSELTSSLEFTNLLFPALARQLNTE